MELDAVLASIAECVHDERVHAGLTLEQLAVRAELSAAHLSRIESGDRQPSIAALIALSRALGVSISALLGERERGPKLSVHPGDGPAHRVNGLTISGVSGYPGSSMLEALKVTVEPDRIPPVPSTHRGEEWIYVLAGTLRLECGGETHLLETGCTAHFDAEQPHRLSAVDTPATLLVVAADALKDVYRTPLFTSKSLVH
jgi:transcriptional regulator with XRE-family HTH domain